MASIAFACQTPGHQITRWLLKPFKIFYRACAHPCSFYFCRSAVLRQGVITGGASHPVHSRGAVVLHRGTCTSQEVGACQAAPSPPSPPSPVACAASALTLLQPRLTWGQLKTSQLYTLRGGSDGLLDACCPPSQTHLLSDPFPHSSLWRN